jgi:hypothetical protein
MTSPESSVSAGARPGGLGHRRIEPPSARIGAARLLPRHRRRDARPADLQRQGRDRGDRLPEVRRRRVASARQNAADLMHPLVPPVRGFGSTSGRAARAMRRAATSTPIATRSSRACGSPSTDSTGAMRRRGPIPRWRSDQDQDEHVNQNRHPQEGHQSPAADHGNPDQSIPKRTTAGRPWQLRTIGALGRVHHAAITHDPHPLHRAAPD